MEFSFRRFNRFRCAASFIRGPIVAARFQRGRKFGSQRAPREFVPVEPSRSYHFHAALRTEGITTENGISFLISDPIHGAATVTTENLTGMHTWTPVDVDYTTGPQTHFLVVQVRRSQSRLFENKLSGTVWIGDVSLTPSSAPPPSK